MRHLLKDLRPCSDFIVLFGSRGRGDQKRNSDFDLYVVTWSGDKVKECIRRSRLKGRVDVVIWDPLMHEEMHQLDPQLEDKIYHGWVLHRGKVKCETRPKKPSHERFSSLR